ncbi:MAG TPA: NfeD family protein [Gammaproteobacteria bacterium]|nr:NfeD family protein [Gammaproteobacteria bacterium]
MLEQMDFWHWFIMSLVLIVLEMFLPGASFLWIGIAAALTGGLLWLMPNLEWTTQVLVFAVLSVLSVLAWRSWAKKHPVHTDQPALNRRGEHYLNRVFTLDEAIVNGVGKIRVDDSTWKVEGLDCAAGSKVKVVGVDGVILRVESA